MSEYDDEIVDDFDDHDIPDITESPQNGFGLREALYGVVALVFVVIVYLFFASLEDDGADGSAEQLDIGVQTVDQQENRAADLALPERQPPQQFYPGDSEPVESDHDLFSQSDLDALLRERDAKAEADRRRREIEQQRMTAHSSVYFNLPDNTLAVSRTIDDLLAGELSIEEQIAEAEALYGDGANTPGSNPQSDSREGFLEIPQLRHQSVRAGVIDNVSSKVLQGTLINFVLETAIDSTLPGMVRGLTTENIYSADGKTILLPRHSRIIGEYRAGVRQGEERVFIIWTRLITPSHIDIALDSPAADSLGRSGMSGRFDSNFFKRFGGSILLSIIGGAAQQEAENEVQRQEYAASFNDSASIALENSINIPPTIKVKQGASGYVFVARDIDFSDPSVQQRLTALATKRPTTRRQASSETREQRLARAEQLDARLRAEQAEKDRIAKEKMELESWIERCSFIAIEKDRFLSTAVRTYLERCDSELLSWNVSSKAGRPVDFKPKETIRVELHDQINSLQTFLMNGYSLRLTDLGNNVYAVSNASTTDITISTE